MIKFIRKIRQSLLPDNLPFGGGNKISKYLLYAVGEIILVVIGILIALWINNKNQDHIKQVKLNSILVKIQNDFLQDIDQGEELLVNYIRKDSIADRIIGGNLSYEEVKAIPKYGRSGIEYVTTWWTNYQLQSNGYDQLMTVLDDIPDKYDDLVSMLNHNYKHRQAVFETISKNSKDIVMQYGFYLANNQNWLASDTYRNEMSDEQIDYMMNNPRFKNQINLLVSEFETMTWQSIRNREELIQMYMMINELLGEKARPLPKGIRRTSLADESTAQRLVGFYTKTSGPQNTSLRELIEISNEGKDLYIHLESGRKLGPLINVNDEKLWFSIVDGIDIYQFEYNVENKLRVVHPRTDQTHWLKVKK